MSLFVSATASNQSTAEWVRQVATALNAATARQSFPFQRLDAAPATPDEGQCYYDLTTHKARCWDGTAWNDLF